MDQPRLEDAYPLSPIQLGMLIHQLRGLGTGVDLEQGVGELREQIDETAFVRAVEKVCARHAVLRTRFRWVGLEEPRQEVLLDAPAEVAIHDFTSGDAFEAFLAADRRRGFDLSQAPLLRFTIFRAGAARSLLVFTYAHALLDSCVVEVLRELFELYECERSGGVAITPERRPYRAHIEWLREHLAATRPAAQQHFRTLLEGFTQPTRLTALESPALDGPAISDGPGERHFLLSAETSDRLRSLGEARAVRLSTLFHAAFGLALGNFTGDDDVVFGSTRACRRSAPAGSEGTIGLFINTLPLRLSLDPAQRLSDWLAALEQQQRALRPFEQTPLSQISDCAPLLKGTPLFEHIVIFTAQQNDARLKALGGAWLGRDFRWIDQTNFPLNLMAFGDARLNGKISYARARFGDAAAERFTAHLCMLLDALANAAPDASLGDLPRLLPAERARLEAWNRTAVAPPLVATIHGQIEAQVARTPKRTAVVFRDQSLTYEELDRAAEELAVELRGLGVGAGLPVGVYAPRSLEMLIGMLGILKAGGAYVPLDPAYPRERIGWMLEDIRATVVVTTQALRSQLAAGAARVVAVDEPRALANPPLPAAPGSGEQLAYVLFTSGSTGRPKGVQVRHRNATNFFTGMDAVLGSETPGTWLAVTSISFDISVLELLWTLARGFKVVLQQELAPSARRPAARKARAKPLEFGLFYFAAEAASGADKYRLLLEGARFADTHGFSAVWTPERHFHAFGGLYPNPSLTSAALATITSRVQLRAGSVVLPLHNPIRCAEEWSVVDNLSNGRVGLSFASGWHASDFALMPGNFADRRRLMAEGIETVRALWRGEEVAARSGDGREIRVRIYPAPVQREPPIWLTASGNPETFEAAGKLGANVLTNLLVMTREELARNIAVYRKARSASGHPGEGCVSLMLHTFVGRDEAEVLRIAREPFLDYLRTSTDLIAKTRWQSTAFALPGRARREVPPGDAGSLEDLSPDELRALLDHAFERYVKTAGLFGTPAQCRETASELHELGVDEIACLIDFGVAPDQVLANLPMLDELRLLCAQESGESAFDGSIAAQLVRHDVSHLQCTPSLASVFAADPKAAAALGSLRKLLLGGEALPPALLQELHPLLHAGAEVINLYGPTETTVWSTAGAVEPGAPVRLGRPLANTLLAVVDRHLRPLPPGVPGELLIGGAGVARGYLDRPELTAERFVQHGAGTFYRTGDLVRLCDDDSLEFLGRLDHQVKINGHRIELGEIEAVLGRHPGVREAAVVARRSGPAARLVAYVVPRGAESQAGAVAAWQTVWDGTYQHASGRDPQLDLAGWTSSFTGAPLPETEMLEWRERTLERIRALSPQRVLEVGCGSGLLLLPLAPGCARYLGLDFSAAALARVSQATHALGLQNVELQQRAAHDLGGLGERGFDTIVLNSVVQYFPSVGYLLKVLDAAWARLEPGGAIFLGDVRSLPLQEAFCASVELARAPAGVELADVQARVREAMARERELLLEPALFPALARRFGDLAFAQVLLKGGRAWNEMSAFRYDVVLRKRGPAIPPAAGLPAPGAQEASTAQLRALLELQPAVLRASEFVNRRAASSVQLARDLREGVKSLAVVRATNLQIGIDPEELDALDPRYRVEATWAASGDPSRFDALFVRRELPSPRAADPGPLRPWSDYANQPQRAPVVADLEASLRVWLRRSLPDFMQPGALLFLPCLPRTPNGKLDRGALPEPERNSPLATPSQEPQNELERAISEVFGKLLELTQVNAEANFFDLGANSLLLVRASNDLRTRVGRELSLVDLFQHPTVRKLAAHLAGGASPAASPKLDERSQSRRESLQRRLGARQSARTPTSRE